MKKVILLVAIIAIAGLSVGLSIACASETTPTPTPTPIPITDGQGPPAEVHTWLSPGKVQIGNFYPGARAEWPVTIHYGATQTDSFTCITGQQTTDFAILGKPLYDGSLTYIYGWDEGSKSPSYYHPSIAPWWDETTNPTILALTSSHANDTLMVTGYDKATRTLYLSGLISGATRILDITYSHNLPGQFEVYYKWVGDNAISDGFEPAPIEALDWVIVADPTPILMPFETREILITVTMPKGASAPDRWEFQIGMTNKSIGGQVVVEMASRWMVTMR